MAHPTLPRLKRPFATVAAGVVAGIAAALVLASSASAHVHVDGPDATQGGYSMLTFRVPTESETASTTSLTVTLPSDTPLAYVATQPKPGWTATVTTADLTTPVQNHDGELTTYVSSVTWTADSPDGGIGPGEFDTFSVLAGPLPEVDSVTLPVAQGYSDGTVVEHAAVGG